jgi:lipoprotein-anchoring transpeptidase ErfK/SrfK
MIRKNTLGWMIIPALLCSVSTAYAKPAKRFKTAQAAEQTPPVAAPTTPAPATSAPALPTEPVITQEPATPATPPATPPVTTTPPVVTPPVITPPKPPKPPRKGYTKTDPGDKLRPGQYVWEARTAYKNPLRIIAVLDFQRIYVFDGEELVAFSTISSGKKGNDTPPGVFPILEKKVEHYSNLYNNAPMPYMQRLTWDGIAMHVGAIPGYPASHGCIRLPAGFAKQLFKVTKLAQQVIVIQDTSAASRAEAEAADPNAVRSNGGGEAGVAAPEPKPVIK